jgi:hypothetical protein
MEKEMINREWVDSLSIFERDLLKAYLDICRIPYPISLSEIYERYHYGMYALPKQRFN